MVKKAAIAAEIKIPNDIRFTTSFLSKKPSNSITHPMIGNIIGK
jgi:hypothetical protein